MELLSPQYSTDLHNTVSELLKAIIALSAPSPASLSQNQSAEAFGGAGGFASGDSFGGGSVGSVNNRLVRELASEAMVRKMVGFMLDKVLPTRLVRRLTDAAEEQLARLSLDGIEEDAKPARRRPSKIGTPSSRLGPLRELNSDSSDSESALEEEDEPFQLPLNPRECPASESRSPTSQMDHRGSTATVRPTDFFPPVRPPTVPITPESATSSLVTVISVFIELIRKNNSDYFEQHLFHTLRTHLLQRQQEISERRTFRAADISTDSTDTIDGKAGAANAAKSEEDEEMEGMEEAMAELAGRLGIVHLGPMLKVLCERLHEFQALIEQPRSSVSAAILF